MATRIIEQPLLNSIPENLLSRLDPTFVEYYNRYEAGRIHTHQVPIEEYRRNPAKYTIQYGRAEGGKVYRISEQNCPVKDGEISIRIFEPEPQANRNQSLQPAYINFHGGAFTFGSLESDDPFCRHVVNEVGCVVFDVNYRHAPEHGFPTPIEDAWSAFQWVRLGHERSSWCQGHPLTGTFLIGSQRKGRGVSSRREPHSHWWRLRRCKHVCGLGASSTRRKYAAGFSLDGRANSRHVYAPAKR